MKLSQLSDYIQESEFKKELDYLYGSENSDKQIGRYQELIQCALKDGDREATIFSAPGRSEVGGNHTDHQLGCVLACSIDLDTIAVVVKNDENIIRYESKGFNVKPVDLSDLTMKLEEKNTTESLFRGIANGFASRGYQYGGFDMYASSNVILGGGMSSSASFEVLIGTVLSHLYNNHQVSAEEIAMIGQYAENQYFLKPCGLMDQMACSVGSFVSIDFKEKGNPKVEKVDFNLDQYNYNLILTDVKASHADLSDAYASIPSDMKAVAKVLGHELLTEVTLEDLVKNAARIRKESSDRAFLRAYHYVNETKRAILEATALKNNDFKEFLKLVNESGQSSWMYLQNIYVPEKSEEQPVSLALALSKAVLKEEGASRVHGGGFAGTIQAFVPHTLKDEYISTMESVFGKGCCYCIRIRPVGGTKLV